MTAIIAAALTLTACQKSPVHWDNQSVAAAIAKKRSNEEGVKVDALCYEAPDPSEYTCHLWNDGDNTGFTDGNVTVTTNSDGTVSESP